MNQKTLVFATLILLVALSSCIERERQRTPIYPDFEQTPPTASKIYFELLEKPNKKRDIRVVAEFDQANDKIDNKYFAVEIQGEKYVLRDDGRRADETANDGKYSLYIQEDVDALIKELSDRREICMARKEGHTFVNRCYQNIDLHNLPDVDYANLEKGQLVQFPIELLQLGVTQDLDPAKTLMITDLGVVEDPTRTFNPCTKSGNPTGVWTFGTLMREMVKSQTNSDPTDQEVSAFVMEWLNTWMTDATVNGDNLPARTAIQDSIISPWLAKSQTGEEPTDVLKMEFAPFKLTAIVNRLDLRGNSGFGFTDGGEGRFVFCALNENCAPMQFNVIFEYGINKDNCGDITAYAQQWADLNNLALGSSEFNASLENITDQFALSGTDPNKPNQNSLNQLRTNEVALANPWELREFHLTDNGKLELVTVKQEPAIKYNARISHADVEILAKYINDNATDIQAQTHEVPAFFLTTKTDSVPFLAAMAHTPFPPSGPVTATSPHHWNGDTTSTSGPGVVLNDSARHIFSLNTCSGCHGGETQTFFTHIDPVGFGTEATLSGFLTGTAGRGFGPAIPVDADLDPANGVMTVPDPAGRPSFDNPQLRQFNDLERRQIDLTTLLNSLCQESRYLELVYVLTYEPNRMEH